MANNFTLPTINNTVDIFEISKFVNVATGNILFPMILLGIWAIAFIGSIVEGREAVRAWVFASFVSSILGILLGVLGLLARTEMYLLIILLAFGIFWLRLQNPPPA